MSADQLVLVDNLPDYTGMTLDEPDHACNGWTAAERGES